MLKKPTLPLITARAAAAAAAAAATSTTKTTLCGGRVGVSASLGGSIMCFPTTGVSGTSSTSGNGAKHDKHSVGANGTNNGLCGCHKAPKSYCISATGVLLLVLLYTALGSIVFVTLEGELEDSGSVETAVAASKPYPHTELANAEIRSRTVDRLWSITEDLNILYKENWTRLAAQEVQHFQDTLLRAARQSKIYQTGTTMNTPAHKWTYASAFLYSLTLITTIGYGGISPRTQWGRIAALVYALFGIPIVLLYLSAMGEGLSAAMRCIFRRGRRSSKAAGGLTNNNGNSVGGKLTDGNKTVSGGKLNAQHPYATLPKSTYNLPVAGRSSSVPISVCVMVLICYVCAGALLFHKVQNWSILEALYFCFTSLGTIGFGELTPTGNLTIYLASAYILIGMAVVAMCFSLIQTEILMWLRRFSVQDHVMPTKTEDVALVSVAVTPKSS